MPILDWGLTASVQASNAGRYAEAAELLSSRADDVKGTLKFDQYLTACSRINKLKHAINEFVSPLQMRMNLANDT